MFIQIFIIFIIASPDNSFSWGKNILNEIRWRLFLYFISDSCFTYYCDRIWAKRFSFSFERTCIMVRQNAFSKVAFSHVKIFAIDTRGRKYIFSKRTLLYCHFMKYAKKSLLWYSFPNYWSRIILRQKYETGDFAPKISIRSRRINFLHIDVHVTSKLRTFLWCFSFFSKLLVDTMQIDMNDPSDFKKVVPDAPSQKMGRDSAMAQLSWWGFWWRGIC